MSLPALDNLVRIGQLKAEPRNEAEGFLEIEESGIEELCILIAELIKNVAQRVEG